MSMKRSISKDFSMEKIKGILSVQCLWIALGKWINFLTASYLATLKGPKRSFSIREKWFRNDSEIVPKRSKMFDLRQSCSKWPKWSIMALQGSLWPLVALIWLSLYFLAIINPNIWSYFELENNFVLFYWPILWLTVVTIIWGGVFPLSSPFSERICTFFSLQCVHHFHSIFSLRYDHTSHDYIFLLIST